ncbi:hypothetical protein [Prolixibacter denitrificans]|uniref:PepSY-associated transmembrane protein n=2 Tax=Prolixibacter denitrificans TaxID=1541063 RepID=A0A2P8CE57_9BACT|nr:hypothetical protein [Prolixibacter denitrificans]PSK83246.1 hypothetical protein CLV93_104176 [Prolixibacter denitrificans]
MKKRSIHYYMRMLHRYVGYFVLGFTLIYSISGIILVYRDTDFLKRETTVERKLPVNLDEAALGSELHMRGFKIIKTEGDLHYFANGTYNKATGVANYKIKALPTILSKMNSVHKSVSQNPSHLFTTIFGILLLFLAVSSLWMFKPKAKIFKKGMIVAGSGVVIAIALLLI